MLGVAYKTMHGYVVAGRIKAVRVSGVIAISVEEIKNFKPKAGGRPRLNASVWRIAPESNLLSRTSILVQVRHGKLDDFKRRLEEIRAKNEHQLPGTVHRYIAASEKHPGFIEIILIWRSSVMPDEPTREQALEAFRQSLDDVLDWSTAHYDEGTVFMHA